MRFVKQHKHKLSLRTMSIDDEWDYSVWWLKISLIERAILWQYAHGGKFIPLCRCSYNRIPF